MSSESGGVEAMDEELAAKCRAFVMDKDETRGHMSVELDFDGKPVEAKALAKSINNVVRLLEAIDKSKSIRWAVIEANVIGDLASFTVKGYPKEVFSIRKRRKPAATGATP